jgi:rapamycin-insensitive companion of mTOR
VSAVSKVSVTDDNAVNARVLKHVTTLGNVVIASGAMRDLRSLKLKKGSAFQKPQLFLKVMTILEQHHFRLHHIRFVLDLFDKRVMRQIVLEEEEESEEEEDDSDRDEPTANGETKLQG